MRLPFLFRLFMCISFSACLSLLSLSYFSSHRLDDHVRKAPHLKGSGRRGKHHEISHARALPPEVDHADVRASLGLHRLHHLFHGEVHPGTRVIFMPHGRNVTNKCGSDQTVEGGDVLPGTNR